MHACSIKRILAVSNPKESRALLICLWSELWNFEKFCSTLKLTVFFPVINNILGNRLGNTRNILKERCRCGIEINTYFINTVLDNTFKCLSEFLLIHIMLILTDTDRLRIDLNQFCKWILKSSCYGCRASLTNIELWKLLGCKFTCRINRGTRLIYDHILNRSIKFFYKLNDDLFRLS